MGSILFKCIDGSEHTVIAAILVALGLGCNGASEEIVTESASYALAAGTTVPYEAENLD